MSHSTETNSAEALATRLRNDHGARETAVACLLHLTFVCFMRVETGQDRSLQPLLDLQSEMTVVYANTRGLDADQINKALMNLQRASEPWVNSAKVRLQNRTTARRSARRPRTAPQFD